MSFLKNLMGGVAIMIVALLIGIGQNAVRSNPMTLFPRVSKSPAMTGQKGEAAATPVQRAAADRDRPAGDDTVSPGVAAEITPEELAGGEVSKEKVRAVMGTGFAVIVDEAQNLTPHEVKTIVTRCGEGTKIILTGDPFQIDHPYVDSSTNGLTVTAERLKGDSLVGHIVLSQGERSELANLAANRL